MYKNRILPLIIAFFLGAFTHAAFASLTKNAGAETITHCPENTYQIGGTESSPVCKTNPTGCPYAENIPLDSPKCSPPESPTAYDPFVKEEVTVSEPAPEVVQSQPIVYECYK